MSERNRSPTGPEIDEVEREASQDQSDDDGSDGGTEVVEETYSIGELDRGDEPNEVEFEGREVVEERSSNDISNEGSSQDQQATQQTEDRLEPTQPLGGGLSQSPTGPQIDRAEQLHNPNVTSRSAGGNSVYTRPGRTRQFRSSPTGPEIDQVEREGVQGDSVGLEGEEGPVGDAARDAEARFIDQVDGIDSRDQVEVTEDSVELTEEGREALEDSARIRFASQFRNQGIDLSVRDVEVEGGQPRIADDADIDNFDVIGPARTSTEATQRAERGVPTGQYVVRDVESDVAEPTATERDQQSDLEPDRLIRSRVPDEGDVVTESLRSTEEVLSGVAQTASGNPNTRIRFRPGFERGYRDAARTILGEEAPNTEITDQLTEGEGRLPFTLTDEEEAQVREDIEQRQEFFGVGEEAESLVQGLTGSETLASYAGGLGRGVGGVAGTTAGITLLADDVVQGTANLPGTVIDEGPIDTGEAVANTVTSSTRGGVETFEDAPAETAGVVTTGFASGAAVGRAAQAAPSAARGASIRARGGDVVDFEDVSDPPTRTEGMELPGFTEKAQRDAEFARDEFIDQARQNNLAGNDPVAFHGRSREGVDEYGGFGQSFEAPEGSSELPGLFQSADLSNLRLGQRGGSGISLPNVGLPRANLGSGRVLAERDVDVDVAPRGDRQQVSRFLDEDASREQSYVRTDADGPTPEQEVVAPPGSRFESEGVFGVRVGGRSIPGTNRRIGGEIIPGRLTTRVESDRPSTDTETVTSRQMASETESAISSAYRRQEANQEPFVPVGFGGDAASSGGTIDRAVDDPVSSQDVYSASRTDVRRSNTSAIGPDGSDTVISEGGDDSFVSTTGASSTGASSTGASTSRSGSGPPRTEDPVGSIVGASQSGPGFTDEGPISSSPFRFGAGSSSSQYAPFGQTDSPSNRLPRDDDDDDDDDDRGVFGQLTGEARYEVEISDASDLLGL